MAPFDAVDLRLQRETVTLCVKFPHDAVWLAENGLSETKSHCTSHITGIVLGHVNHDWIAGFLVELGAVGVTVPEAVS